MVDDFFWEPYVYGRRILLDGSGPPGQATGTGASSSPEAAQVPRLDLFRHAPGILTRASVPDPNPSFGHDGDILPVAANRILVFDLRARNGDARSFWLARSERRSAGAASRAEVARNGGVRSSFG